MAITDQQYRLWADLFDAYLRTQPEWVHTERSFASVDLYNICGAEEAMTRWAREHGVVVRTDTRELIEGDTRRTWTVLSIPGIKYHRADDPIEATTDGATA
jgi:hypothetical protein